MYKKIKIKWIYNIHSIDIWFQSSNYFIYIKSAIHKTLYHYIVNAAIISSSTNVKALRREEKQTHSQRNNLNNKNKTRSIPKVLQIFQSTQTQTNNVIAKRLEKYVFEKKFKTNKGAMTHHISRFDYTTIPIICKDYENWIVKSHCLQLS